MPLLIDSHSGKIHTTFNQSVAILTGRASSANPNLQNIPVRTEKGRKIERKSFISRNDEFELLAADYSHRIELRIVSLSKDESMLKALI